MGSFAKDQDSVYLEMWYAAVASSGSQEPVVKHQGFMQVVF